MCPPKYYSVKYQINPWMKPGSVDHDLAVTQWENLVETYTKIGIEVQTISPQTDVPDMVFSADQGLVYMPRKIILSNFKYPERQKETEYYEKWFLENDFKITRLDKHYTLEGGDILRWNGKILVGTGFRTSPKTPALISKITGINIIPVELVNPYYYHLDTCLLPLNKDTVFYYPPAFSRRTRENLNKSVPNLITLDKKENNNFATNCTISGDTVVMQKNNPTLKARLTKLGYKTIELDIGEFRKSGGGIHCLTNILEIK